MADVGFRRGVRGLLRVGEGVLRLASSLLGVDCTRDELIGLEDSK